MSGSAAIGGQLVLGLGVASPNVFKEDDTNSPAFTCVQYDRMARRWELIDDLRNGQDHMQLRGQRWLPKEPAEKAGTYLVRLARSFLFDMYSDGVDHLASKPFQEAVTTEGNLHASLKNLVSNIDLEGTSITDFARRLLVDAIDHGLSHFLVDKPSFHGNITLAAQNEGDIRPYFIHIKATNLIGWKIRYARNGAPIISEIRYRATKTVSDGGFGSKEVDTIRVVTESTLTANQARELDGDVPDNLRYGRWVEYSQKEKARGHCAKNYEVSGHGFHSFPGPGLPLVTLYTKKTGILQAVPPLEGLAKVNLEHYQKSSDESNILRFVSIATLFLKGVDIDDIESDEEGGGQAEELGTNIVIRTSNSEADGKYIEHSGKGIGVLQKKLRVLEERGLALGMQPMLLQASGKPETATANRRADEKNTCSLKSWVRNLETAIIEGVRLAHAYQDVEQLSDEAFVVKIFSDFGVSAEATQKIEMLISTRKNRELDRRTFLKGLKRLALLDEDDNIDKIMQALEKEFATRSDSVEEERTESAVEDEKASDDLQPVVTR